MRIDWAETYTKTDMKHVLFTDESRATLDGPDGRSKGWVIRGDQCPARIRRQQEEGESCYGLVLLGTSLLALFVYKKVLN